MQKYNTLTQSDARRFFSFDEGSGSLIWKHRPECRQERNTRFAGKVAGCKHTCTVRKSYIQVRINRVLFYAHRIVWALEHGELSQTLQIDHIDGNGVNNRLDNLRVVCAGFFY